MFAGAIAFVRGAVGGGDFADADEGAGGSFADFFAVDGGDDAFCSFDDGGGAAVLLGAVAVFGARGQFGGFG